jgi:hypothetical protein
MSTFGGARRPREIIHDTPVADRIRFHRSIPFSQYLKTRSRLGSERTIQLLEVSYGPS